MKMVSALVAAGMMAMATPVCAQAVTVTNVSFAPGSVTGKLHSSPFNGDAGVGRFEFTGTYVGTGAAFDIFTYCVDLANYVSLGAVNYTSYSVQPLSALGTITTGKANALNALLSNTMPILNAATGQSATNVSAAVQMAVWEVMFETQPSWSVTDGGGGFHVTAPGGSTSANLAALTSAQSLANTYLSNVAGDVWAANANAELKLLYSPNQQTQVFLQAAAVPEPATWAMMLLGFGGLGYAMRRRTVTGPRVRFV